MGGGSPIRFRFLEISPDQFTSAGLRSAFEIAFYFGKLDWPGTWYQQKVGEVGWALCCGVKHALAKAKSVQARDVVAQKFVLPSYWTEEGFALGNDGCPLAADKRLKGHETSTAEAAMALVRTTDQLAFLPELLIHRHEQLGEVKTLQVKGWAPVRKPLHVAVRSDLVAKRLLDEIVAAVRARLL